MRGAGLTPNGDSGSDGSQISHVAATGRTLRERGLGCSGAEGVRTQGGSQADGEGWGG